MELIYHSGNIIQERYSIINQLGEEGSGITYAAQDLTEGTTVAIKVLSLNQLENWKKIELFERKAKILQQLEHPNIPEYLDYFQLETEENCSFYIVQQLAPGKSLASLIEAGWQPDLPTVAK
ncbi:protein kinase [Waterburya agarophytonicola K14]|uniref:non-specific serine/threonine protein kinase n=1 Tax=Waterburya agarophytonicola KI4 TaxID=2874699 RepID=A0A964BW30_9CYAN|nr:protein kinase [Waterburya agarophytonicola KI4]